MDRLTPETLLVLCSVGAVLGFGLCYAVRRYGLAWLDERINRMFDWT